MAKISFTPKVWAAAGAVVAASTMAAGSAQAVVMTMDAVLSATLATPSVTISNLEGGEEGGSALGATTLVNVDQFDASLGDLLMVEIFLDDEGYSQGEGIAIAELPGCASIECGYEFGVTFDVTGDLSPDSKPVEQSTASGTGIDSAFVGSGFEGGDEPYPYIVTNDALLGASLTYTSALGDFIGAGTWDLGFSVAVQNILFTGDCENGCTSTVVLGRFGDPEQVSWHVQGLKVVYTFDSFDAVVPEPMTLALALPALGALGFAARRRRRSGRAA